MGNKSFIFKFSDVEAHEREFLLVKAGGVLAVEPKAFRVLLILLRNPKKLIPKEELLNAVWGDAAVTENSLTRAIALLRKLLGDDAREPRFIETVATVGYRFVCQVEALEEDAGEPQSTAGAAGRLPASAAPGTAESKTAGRSGRRWMAPALAIAIAGAGVWAWLSFSHNVQALTDKDTVVLSEFANSTGDPVFDAALQQGLEVQLEQSPFLELVPGAQIQHTLSLMGASAGTRLTPQVALEICERIASAAVIEGSIASLGSQYVLGLKAVNCRTGSVLAQTQAQAERKEDVLNSLSAASAGLRAKLGESLRSVEKFDTPLEQATTPSLEALEAYSLGRRELNWHGNPAAGSPLFQRAIELDPNFAMAQLSLGLCYVSLGETGSATESIRRAYELREHVSQWEQFAIESRYDFAVLGDLPKARAVYELWAQVYPREYIPVAVIAGEIDPDLGQYEKALQGVQHALSLSPAHPEAHEALVVAHMNLNQLDKAQATADEAARRGLESTDLQVYLYQLAWLRRDERQMAQQVAWSAGKRGFEDVLLAAEADTAAAAGELGKARELTRRAIAMARQSDEQETAADYQVAAAIREALFGNAGEAREQAAAALELSKSRDVEARAAIALAIAGGLAQPLAEDLARRFPEDTLAQGNYLPTIRGQLAVARGDAAKAVLELQPASPYELGNIALNNLPFSLYPIYVRGNAFLAAREGYKAGAEFQKILDWPGVVLNQPIGALAHLGLARAYRMQGQAAQARSAYRDFFSLWSEADTGVPILVQAREEFAALQ
jgi:eukaryotic-like serine/threonine-protein kinase